ncbi:MAG TPA: NAD(P)/FAD-dependent oxidoreductase [Candidatus Eisenbacteria bacterium]|nr:NAD(P)/FAD-dependent oxidoreductase [Candidatus Eisenbacteria bacterium]
MPRKRHGALTDVLIVGAGPAGLSAALWLRDFGLSCLLLERERQPGGQLHQIHAPIPNYLTAYGWDGARFAGVALDDARAASLEILVGEPVRRIVVERPTRSGPRRGGPVLRVDRGRERLRGRALILATGLRRRALGVPGEKELAAHGVSHSANRDRMRWAQRPVAVIGGGTAAVEDAILCAEVGCDVLLLHHSARFRARNDFLERARAHPKIRIVTNAEVRAIVGKERVEAVRFREQGKRRDEEASVDAVYVRIGWEPATEAARGVVRLDRAGYVRVGPSGRTSARGIYAAGDVCSPSCPSIAGAVGQGAAVAWEIARALSRLPR